MNDALLKACQNDDPAEIAAMMMQAKFWLVNVSEEDQDDTSALVVETEAFPALVGFTSEDHAGTYAEASAESLNEVDELPCFVVNGKELLSEFPKKLGLVLNPETEHCFVFSPDFVRKIKSHCKPR